MPLVVSAEVAPVWNEPLAHTRRRATALYNTPVRVIQRSPDAHWWVYGQFPDYRGWISEYHLAPAPHEGIGWIRIARLYLTAHCDEWPRSDVPLVAGVTLPVLYHNHNQYRLYLSLPGGRRAWIPSDYLETGEVITWPAEQRAPYRGPTAALAMAQQFVERQVSYRWGGISHHGIDCSGLTQVCWKVAGVDLPRNSRQQMAALWHVVTRDGWRPGDLVFFGENGTPNHVAIVTDADHYIHAYGGKGRNGKRVCRTRWGTIPALEATYLTARRVERERKCPVGCE